MMHGVIAKLKWESVVFIFRDKCCHGDSRCPTDIYKELTGIGSLRFTADTCGAQYVDWFIFASTLQ